MLRDLIWRPLAWTLSRPPVTRRLIAYAMRSPYQHIGSPDGRDVYMERYNLLPRFLLQQVGPCTWKPKRWLPVHPRVHQILREDLDLEVHDHPSSYRTVILAGWYEEEDIFGRRRIRMRGDTVRAPLERFHRINRVSKGGVWTLFILGRRSKDPWGFLTGDPPRKVPHHLYRSKNGRGEAIG